MKDIQFMMIIKKCLAFLHGQLQKYFFTALYLLTPLGNRVSKVQLLHTQMILTSVELLQAPSFGKVLLQSSLTNTNQSITIPWDLFEKLLKQGGLFLHQAEYTCITPFSNGMVMRIGPDHRFSTILSKD